jgi:serine/threonine protein phosphatase PrpC
VIQRILGSAAPLQPKADALIEAALIAGGSDNVTVVLCQAEMSSH